MDPEGTARQIELLQGRIGDDLIEAGVVFLPVLLLAYQDLLYLSPVELNATVQIWMDWSLGNGFSSVGKIAMRIGQSKRRLQEVLKELCERDLLLRAGQEPPSWVFQINAAVQEEVTAYCRKTYGDKAPHPPFGYLLRVEQRTAWGMQEENAYSFFPLLAYLRALYRADVRPLRQPQREGVKQISPPPAKSVVGGRTGVHPRDEAGFTPMVMEKTTLANGKAPPFVSNPSTTFFDPIEGIRFVLAHFLNRVAERWPTPGQQGQPLTLAHQRYEAAAALLSPAVSLNAVSQVPAEVVEELVILSWVLWSQEPADLALAIDRVLERAGASPVRRLAYIWPQMPNARVYKKRLSQLLQRGQAMDRLFRRAFSLFAVLNRFDVGPLLADEFVQTCHELGVRRVKTVLEKALQEGRTYVTIGFVRRGVALLGAGACTACPENEEDEEVETPPQEAPREESLERRNALKRAEVSRALREAIWQFGTPDDVRGTLSLEHRLEQTGLSWDSLLDCVREAKKAASLQPPRERLLQFRRVLRQEILQRQKAAGLIE